MGDLLNSKKNKNISNGITGNCFGLKHTVIMFPESIIESFKPYVAQTLQAILANLLVVYVSSFSTNIKPK